MDELGESARKSAMDVLLDQRLFTLNAERFKAFVAVLDRSRSGGKKQVHEIIDAIKTVLHDQPLTLADHHLINLRRELSEARQDPDGDTFLGIVRYRAVTEPMALAA